VRGRVEVRVLVTVIISVYVVNNRMFLLSRDTLIYTISSFSSFLSRVYTLLRYESLFVSLLFTLFICLHS
jgi:hypothetical protein